MQVLVQSLGSVSRETLELLLSLSGVSERALRLLALPHFSVGVSVFHTLWIVRGTGYAVCRFYFTSDIGVFDCQMLWVVVQGRTLPRLCFTSGGVGFVFPPLRGAMEVHSLCHLSHMSFWGLYFPSSLRSRKGLRAHSLWVLIHTAFGLFHFPNSEEHVAQSGPPQCCVNGRLQPSAWDLSPTPPLSLPGCPREQATRTTGTAGLPAPIPHRSPPCQAARRPPAPQRSGSGAWPAPEQPGQPPPDATPGARTCGRSCGHAQQRAPAAQTPRQPPGGSQLLRLPHFCPEGTRL